MKPTPAMEDYLEATLVLKQQDGEVRVKELAEYLGVKPPSVIEMIRNFVAKGLVTHEARKDIRFTPEGLKLAEAVKRRHEVLKFFFQKILGLDEAIADADACAVEHALSKEAMTRLEMYIQKHPSLSGFKKKRPSNS